MTMIPGQENTVVLDAIGRLFGWVTQRLRRAMAGSNTIDAPIITTHGINESASLLGAASGKLAGYDYVLLSNANDRVMLLVTLPFNTGLHIVAIGDKSHSFDADIRLSQRKWLEPVSLEGDFPTRFEMYVSKDRQVEVRQLFEPNEMWNFYTLCRTYDFELFHESVYFSVAAGAHDSADSTPLVTDAEVFLRQNADFFNRAHTV